MMMMMIFMAVMTVSLIVSIFYIVTNIGENKSKTTHSIVKVVARYVGIMAFIIIAHKVFPGSLFTLCAVCGYMLFSMYLSWGTLKEKYKLWRHSYMVTAIAQIDKQSYMRLRFFVETDSLDGTEDVLTRLEKEIGIEVEDVRKPRISDVIWYGGSVV
jgi:hypothetical protein